VIIPDDNFGQNLDPLHLALQMVDYERVVREFGDKIFHLHAKDLNIDRKGLFNHGVLSQSMGWQVPGLPGLGDMNWAKFFAALTVARYAFFFAEGFPLSRFIRIFEFARQLS
jgi:sugar phosphate isomerase/epimerase